MLAEQEKRVKRQRQERLESKDATGAGGGGAGYFGCGGVDGERDMWYRTVLHYTYGMEGSRHAVNTLMQFGASEFTLDKVW